MGELLPSMKDPWIFGSCHSEQGLSLIYLLISFPLFTYGCEILVMTE